MSKYSIGTVFEYHQSRYIVVYILNGEYLILGSTTGSTVHVDYSFVTRWPCKDYDVAEFQIKNFKVLAL